MPEASGARFVVGGDRWREASGSVRGNATCRGRRRSALGRRGAGVHMQCDGRAQAVIDEIPRNLRQVLRANLRQVLRDALHIGQERTASESRSMPWARAVGESE
eukprot:scaffold58121_cov74-Phaeocystis_antarctica.AAC.5